MELPTISITSPTIHVSNIPSGKGEELTSTEALLSLFIPFGPIAHIQYSANQPFTKITYAELDDAREAILNMNGFRYFGKYLNVTEDQEKADLADDEQWVKGRAVWDQEEPTGPAVSTNTEEKASIEI
ncbi:hypothetical protein BABINDRAFT_160678 [Babjeviella inositovora NRRL Y-12698]|uniref:RRM domain-containing protein n=1 Tax=Babjeviella inositovora NRRL Y-12698 TaxID=984486 RepID=A0A1E3QWD9_9ASCO|nr:uncharacterized protein BABINDRAFT_160678 [Babjeviella inositovora NRRL Y-12698]ODQ81317.1 hypothetical protein BABINDRAFT_160678 [Babjeviella inositovora NRRL Y-12698]